MVGRDPKVCNFPLQGRDFGGYQKPQNASGVWCGCLVGCVGVWDSQKLPNLMSRKKLGGSFWIVRNLGFERIVKLRGALLGRWKLGGSFWIVRNLGFERIVKLRGLYWIGGNLEGRFR